MKYCTMFYFYTFLPTCMCYKILRLFSHANRDLTLIYLKQVIVP